MASPEETLTAVVTGDAGLAALIGDRFFPIGTRQDVAYPYVTYQRIATPRAKHLNGKATLQWPRFQLNIWADTKAQARAVADALDTLLDAVEHTAAGLTIECTLQDDRSAFDEATRKPGVSQDYLVWHSR